ncbi:hypothetical protein [Kutzneria albida]|uniref:Uncharacterized protein n=1 Tax=Kutzneria albida DSM 43870 TaxID=1449976 RepID=W5WFF4_9PSEU|nr:hypothetical protein [Kutzneria albida]AHH99480.1 hypothetical protein KALB_6120 [Kutzneria albida DSM 43870]
MTVLHRLALGVQPIDGGTGLQLGGRVRVGRETPAGRYEPLESNGTGRFKLRHGPGVGDRVTVRVHDPLRQFVPRRFSIPLWTLAEVTSGPYVPTASRLLRPWLLPGSAYPAPSGATGIRGRVIHSGQPVCWPRITALGPGGVRVGWAHGDERGEFLVLISTTGTLPPPAPSLLPVELVVCAPREGADLVVEPVPRSTAPPAPGDLDNELLRGQSTPAGYLTSTAPRPHLAVRIGEVLTTQQDVIFTP